MRFVTETNDIACPPVAAIRIGSPTVAMRLPPVPPIAVTAIAKLAAASEMVNSLFAEPARPACPSSVPPPSPPCAFCVKARKLLLPTVFAENALISVILAPEPALPEIESPPFPPVTVAVISIVFNNMSVEVT